MGNTFTFFKIVFSAQYLSHVFSSSLGGGGSDTDNLRDLLLKIQMELSFKFNLLYICFQGPQRGLHNTKSICLPTHFKTRQEPRKDKQLYLSLVNHHSFCPCFRVWTFKSIRFSALYRGLVLELSY